MSNSSSSSGGIGVLGLLGVAFIVLKLTHTIDWSWWWVTAPFWGGVALWAVICVLVLGAAAFFAVIAAVFGGKSSKRKW